MKTMARLGCLHAHHSNIGYVDRILATEPIEAVHFVEPGLLRRISSDPAFDLAEAEAQVRRQLGWMADCSLDAILITCTNYIATLPEKPLGLGMPIVKIDEPFFAWLLEQPAPRLIVFANPATVEGTMRRFREFAVGQEGEVEVEVEVIPGIFDLFLEGRTADYSAAVGKRLRELTGASGYGTIAVGQLSMVDAAREVSAESGMAIGDPLQPLHAHLSEVLATSPVE